MPQDTTTLTIHAFLSWLEQYGVTLHWTRAHPLSGADITDVVARYQREHNADGRAEVWFMGHRDTAERDRWGSSTTSKIAAIKAIRAMLFLGLKDAKELVEGPPVSLGRWPMESPLVAQLADTGCMLEWR
jgi:ribosomal protein L7/L12